MATKGKTTKKPAASKKTAAVKRATTKATANKATTAKTTAKPAKAAKKSVARTTAKKVVQAVKTAAKAVTKKATTSKKPASKKAVAKPTSSKPTSTTKAVSKASSTTTRKKSTVNKAVTKSSTAPKRSTASKAKSAVAIQSTFLSSMGIEPYKLKKTEDYMNETQRQHFENILTTWRQSLMEEVDRTVSHMKDEAANFPDPNDRASQEEEFTLELRARDRERKLIKKINEALARIVEDDFGYCDACGIEIGLRRLEARPTATLCVDCKTLAEMKEKQISG